MPSISEASANAKKLKEQIAEQAGVETNYVNDKNLVEAQKMLHGAEAVSAKGQDPRKVDPATLKSIGSGGEPVQSKPSDVSKQQKIAMVITAIAPTLLGAAFGGKEGGAMGANVSVDALKTMGAAERERTKDERDLAARKDLKTLELQARAEDNAQNRANQKAIAEMNADASKGSKEISNEMARERLRLAQERADTTRSNQAKEGTLEGRLAKLSKEKQDSVYKAKEAIQAVHGMGDAMKSGDNTFSVVGDNDYTRNRTMFEEALGRMQSGGAITKDEERRFRTMAPTFRDSADQQQKKLVQLESMMQERLQIMGFKPEEFGIQPNYVNALYKPQEGQQQVAGGGNPTVDSANAAPTPAGRQKPLEQMSEAELEAHVKKLKGQ